MMYSSNPALSGVLILTYFPISDSGLTLPQLAPDLGVEVELDVAFNSRDKENDKVKL